MTNTVNLNEVAETIYAGIIDRGNYPPVEPKMYERRTAAELAADHDAALRRYATVVARRTLTNAGVPFTE